MKLVVDLPCALSAESAGGKGRSLSVLAESGLPVPRAFVIVAAALDEALEAAGGAADPSSLPLDSALAAEIEAALARLGPGPVAVRSSGVEEDGAERSFAGVHDTFLDVEGLPGVLEAVRRCWGSAFSERARAYRGEGAARPRIAVVVQRMVRADVAGVAFSCDPVARRRDRTVVEAVPGLGEALVSGRATPDRAVLDREGTALRLEAAPGRPPCLDERLAREVAAAALRVERLMGHPVDVEWAVERGTLQLLQARPVTTPLDPVRPPGPRTVWSNTNAAEVLPGVATPMTFAIAERYVASLVGPALAPFGVDARSLRISGLVAGRVYFDVNMAMGWLRALPGMRRRSPAFLARIMGGDERTMVEALAALSHEERPARFPLRRLLAGTLHLAVALLRNHRADGAAAVAELREQTERDARVDLGALDDGALVERLDRLSWTPFGAVRAFEGIAASMVGMACAVQLPKLTARWLGDAGLGLRLLQCVGGFDSADAGSALAELGGLARRLGLREQLEGPIAGVRSRLERTGDGRAFLGALAEFLARHGHHCRAESDVAAARWAEEPEYVLAQVRAAAEHGGGGEAAARERSRRGRALVASVEGRLGPVRRRILRAVRERAARGAAARENGRSEATRRIFLVRRALLEVGSRLASRGAVAARDDVFFLVPQELPAALRGAPVMGLVAERRREHARNLRLSPPPVVIGDYLGDEPGAAPSPAAGALHGIAASPGVVVGRARVVLREDAEAAIRPGEILIAPFTDPGWTPYLVAAAGVVMDFGGALSHGAVVAREYGIPAVVNVGSATRTIATGQRVRVDGDRGIVEVLEEA